MFGKQPAIRYVIGLWMLVNPKRQNLMGWNERTRLESRVRYINIELQQSSFKVQGNCQ